MLIMNSAKMIYVHLQKCGGTSVELSFEPHCRWNDVLLGSSALGESIQWQYHAKYGLNKHSSAVEIRRVVGDELWSQYFSWCTVRSPFSRIASLYSYAKSLVFSHAAEAGLRLDAPLESQRQWADSRDYPKHEPWTFPAVKAFMLTCSHSQPFSAFLRSGYLQGEDAYLPQWWGVQSHNGQETAVTEVVRLEDLATAWPRLCEKVALPGVPLRHANATGRQFSVRAKVLFKLPEDVAFIRDRFSEDFEHFGYPDQPT
jgi:hypothetical protein